MAIHTRGTVIQRGDGATPTENFVSIEEVQTIGGPDGTAGEIDTTHLESVVKEFIMGLPNNGSIALTMNYQPGSAQQEGLLTDRDAQTLRNFKLTFPDALNTTLNFAAYVLQWATNSEQDNRAELSVTLRIAGIMTKTTS